MLGKTLTNMRGGRGNLTGGRRLSLIRNSGRERRGKRTGRREGRATQKAMEDRREGDDARVGESKERVMKEDGSGEGGSCEAAEEVRAPQKC